jgi:SAM-dependent methyltransferase
MTARNCRFCSAPLDRTFCDLGMSPLSNAFIKPADAHRMEPFYPLHAYVCTNCFLVQLEQFETPANIFSDYVYFSSYSDTWLAHARDFAAKAVREFGLNAQSLVVEAASNDGYLLQYFKQAGVPVLGIEPARNVAAAALEKGIPTVSEFLGVATAQKLAADGKRADLLIGNNVFAHVPDLNDFAAGLHALLKPAGVLTLEFPHLLKLMQNNQFDTIYHEHFSYFSFATALRVLKKHALAVFDVEELQTHGGSLRVYASGDAARHPTPRVQRLLDCERAAGLDNAATYDAFAEQVKATKRALLRFLLDAKDAGKNVAGYGAPAKANTLLNYCGIRTDFIEFTVDRNPHKQGLLLPGTRVPVMHPDRIFERRPDYVLILPWNLRDEIIEQMAGIRGWGGKFVVPMPRPTVC